MLVAPEQISCGVPPPQLRTLAVLSEMDWLAVRPLRMMVPKFIDPLAVKVSGLTTLARTSTGAVTLTGAATAGAATRIASSPMVRLCIAGPFTE